MEGQALAWRTATIVEAGSAGLSGIAAYAEHVTPTAGGGFGMGSLGGELLAVTVTCVTDSADRDLVVLIFPNLRRGERPVVGDYQVRLPDDSTLTREQRLDPSRPEELCRVEEPRPLQADLGRRGFAAPLHVRLGGEVVPDERPDGGRDVGGRRGCAGLVCSALLAELGQALGEEDGRGVGIPGRRDLASGDEGFLAAATPSRPRAQLWRTRDP